MKQALLDVPVLGLLSNSLNVAGVSSFLQVLAIALVIPIPVIFDRLKAQEC